MRCLPLLLTVLVLAGCGVDERAAGPAQAPDAAAPVVWAVGDGAAGVPVARRLAQRIAAADPARVLYLGDVYETGTPAEFRTRMRGTYRELLRRMLPTPGNHEWPNHERGYDRFWARYGIDAPWYAQRVGDWQVLSLNSEADHGPGSRQLRWLRRRLAEPAACRLAFLHRPRFNAGVHGDAADLAPLWNALEGRAALVLSGHDHNTQRFAPVGGTVQVVAGAGGRERYPVDAGDDRLAFSDDDHFAALRLVLGAAEARLRVITPAGRTLDSATVPCP